MRNIILQRTNLIYSQTSDCAPALVLFVEQVNWIKPIKPPGHGYMKCLQMRKAFEQIYLHFCVKSALNLRTSNGKVDV